LIQAVYEKFFKGISESISLPNALSKPLFQDSKALDLCFEAF